MYQVFNEQTGVCVQRAGTLERALEVASNLTEVHAWIGGQTFDVRVV